MSIAAIVEHGLSALPLIEDEEITRRRDGLDQGTITVLSASGDDYPPNSTAPRYAGMVVLDNSQRLECICDDLTERWQHRLSVVGVKSSKAERRISQKIKRTLDTWDEATEVWLTTNRNRITAGMSMADAPSMIAQDPEVADLDVSGWYLLTVPYRGLYSGAEKPIRMEISSNVEIIQRDSIIVAFSGGWDTAQKGQIQWPKVTVTFTQVTPYIPTANLPEQGSTPPAAMPAVQIISELGDGDGLTYHWPNGWRRTSFNPKPMTGTQLCETVQTWEFQQKQTF